MKRDFTLPGDDTVLPKGTRVVVVTPAVDAGGARHRPGALAVVRDVDGTKYTVETPAGDVFVVERSALKLERADLLAELGRRQWDERRLRDHVIYAAVVGSKAWGLDDEKSDEDVRGCFVLPFEEHSSLFDAPDEIHHGERAYWEIEKLIRQGLRADPNTLETLWSPLVKLATPLGERLRNERAMFSSQRVVQSFGRYAQSQLDKLARSALRAEATAKLVEGIDRGRIASVDDAKRTLGMTAGDDVHDIVRSLFDRGLVSAASLSAVVEAVRAIGPERLVPDEVRPKNAYNLLRLLASCLHWLDHGEPLIRVDDVEFRAELFAIKRGETPLENVLSRGRELAKQIDEHTTTKLPKDPDLDAADALLREARRAMMRKTIAVDAKSDAFVRTWFRDPLPADVDVSSTRRFLEAKLHGMNVVVVGLTGAHAYGFPSPDSDLDLKAIHAAPASTFLGLKDPPGPLEVIEVFEGREMDLSSHEMGMAARLLLKGNGNMLERLLGPMTIVVSPIGERLASIAKRSLSKRVVHHYRGFLRSMKPDGTAKRLLYAYRVACTGAHLLLERELVTDVRSLAPRFGFAKHVEELVARKRAGEFVTVDDTADFAALDELLSSALAQSALPDEPDQKAIADLDALLVESRL
jgi:predicted nucleotidyltransferase